MHANPYSPLQPTHIPYSRACCDWLVPHPIVSHNARPQVCASLHPRIPAGIRASMVAFNEALSRAVVVERRFGRAGSPWEFNLRDVLRWCELAESAVPVVTTGRDCLQEERALTAAVSVTFAAVYLHRMRTDADRAATRALFEHHFPGTGTVQLQPPALSLTDDFVHIGTSRLPRSSSTSGQPAAIEATSQPLLLRGQLLALEAAAAAISQGWMVVLVGDASSGKTSLARSLASLAGATLREVRAPGLLLLGCSDLSGKDEPTTLCFDRHKSFMPLLRSIFFTLNRSTPALPQRVRLPSVPAIYVLTRRRSCC